MINTFNQFGISSAYRVTKPSNKPAATVNGIVAIKILKPALKPIFNEAILEYVFGNNMEAPRINPAAASITMAKISIEP